MPPTPTATISTFFCLKAGRTNFDLDPAVDSDFLFGDQQWSDDIDKRLQRSVAMNRPLRLVWWGQYGIGKTHRLRYMKNVIDKKGYAFYPCFAVASDLQDKSGFERLHSQLLGSIASDRIRPMTESYLLKLHTGMPVVPIETLADTAPDVAAAVKNFGSKNINVATAAWQYLAGQKLDRNDMVLAGASKPQIDTAVEFAAVHHVLGHILREETGGKTLLYLIDEVENLTKIKNKNTAARWSESLRALLDVKNIAVVFTVGAENLQGIPPVIVSPDIVRRMQTENYEPMAAYKAPTATKFVQDVLAELIEQSCRTALEATNGWVSGSNDYDSACYPFTASAFRIFCNHAVNDPRNAKPSEILNALNNAAYEAMVANSPLITPAILSTLNMN
jgi:hypothetical protein